MSAVHSRSCEVIQTKSPAAFAHERRSSAPPRRCAGATAIAHGNARPPFAIVRAWSCEMGRRRGPARYRLDARIDTNGIVTEATSMNIAYAAAGQNNCDILHGTARARYAARGMT